MNEGHRYWIGMLAMIFLGVTFMVAGMGKLLVNSASSQPFAFPVFLPQVIIDGIYSGLPWVEITVGWMLIMAVAIKFTISLSAILVAAFMASNIFSIYLGHGSELCGGCFGFMGGLTVVGALIFDVVMAVMVLIILVCYYGNFFNIRTWFLIEKREIENVEPSFTEMV